MGPHGKKTEHGCRGAADRHGRDNGTPEALDACEEKNPDRVARRAEVCGVAHRWKARMAHEYVEARGKYGKYANLDRETDVIGAHEERKKKRNEGHEEKREEPDS